MNFLEQNVADSELKYPVQRVTIEGESTNVLLMRHSDLQLMPIINAPPNHIESPTVSIAYKDVRIVLPYSHLGVTSGVRIVTSDCQEFILIFKSEK